MGSNVDLLDFAEQLLSHRTLREQFQLFFKALPLGGQSIFEQM
jgi:hypothetical protein